ncbi:MAG TPA: ATP-grasp domain-containing protein [Acidimicrobiales bacterium]|nr:ATP-grasp domain-containing protein [Acidimicrobiales bacterium]
MAEPDGAFLLFVDLPKVGPYLAVLQARGLAPLVITAEPSSSMELAAARHVSDADHRLASIRELVSHAPADATAIVDTIGGWRTRYRIVGAFCASEPFVEAAAVVHDLLDLPGVGHRAARVSRNKFLQRSYLPDVSPRYTLVTAGTDGPWSIDFPAIVKPLDLWSSIGVRTVEDEGSLHARLAEHPPGTHLLLEERIDGREFNVDAIVVGGRPAFTGITQKGTNEEGSEYFVELVHTHPPTNVTSAEAERILDVHLDVVRQLSFDTGMAHAEYRVTGDGRVVLMEIAARPPGDGCLALYHLATGESLESLLVAGALGIHGIHPGPRRRARQVYFEHDAGVLHSVEVDAELAGTPEWLTDTGIWPDPRPGAPTDPPTLRNLFVLKERGEKLLPITESSTRAVTAIFDCPIEAAVDDFDERVRRSVQLR